jgi:hypothetical protein
MHIFLKILMCVFLPEIRKNVTSTKMQGFNR